jgi:predicted ATPase
MPALLSDTELEALQRKVQGATRERMLREMAEALEVLTAEQPLVLVIEDVHWSDHSTLDLLSLLARRRRPARLLLLATYRPTDVIVSRHTLCAMKQELQVHGQSEELPLGFLTATEVNQYVAARFPQQEFPRELVQTLYQSTEGNPLFMVNVVDDWVSQGVLVETDGRWRLTAPVEGLAAGIPESLRQMIEKHLARLMPEEQRVVVAASVVGEEFVTAAVAAGLEEQAECGEELCEGLAARGQFIRARGMETLADGTITGRYGFVHALYQQVLYERLAAVRRTRLHRRIGEWEEQAFGTRVGEHATELAMHFERGRDYPRAVHYLGQAAENAMRRNAYQEAIALLNRALGTLKLLPDTPERTQQELALHIALGVPLLMTKGYAAPEIEQTYARAHEICQRLGAHPQHLPALAGLFRFHLVRSELATARVLGEQVMHLAQNSADPLFRAAAHSMLGVTLAWLGEFPAAREHLEQGQHLYDPQRHRYVALLYGDDTGVVCRAYGASILWYLGYPDQARRSRQAALALAREVAVPHIVAFALDSAAWLHLHCREEDTTWEYLAALEALASTQGFQHWVAASTILRGRRLVQQCQEEEGIALMRQGLAAYRTTGAELGRAQFLALLVEAYGQIGQTEEGLMLLTEALTAIHKTGERHCEAELYRLQGELTLQQARASHQHVKSKSTRRHKKMSVISAQSSIATPHADAEACFLKAIEIARRQQAKSLELRATTSLARLWQQQGKQKEAHRMLSEVYGWFTEGFDTKDLQEAKALSEELH